MLCGLFGPLICGMPGRARGFVAQIRQTRLGAAQQRPGRTEKLALAQGQGQDA